MKISTFLRDSSGSFLRVLFFAILLSINNYSRSDDGVMKKKGTVEEKTDITNLQNLNASNPFSYAEDRTLDDYEKILNITVEEKNQLKKFIENNKKNGLTWLDSGAGRGNAQISFIEKVKNDMKESECNLVGLAKYLPPNVVQLAEISQKIANEKKKGEHKVSYKFHSMGAEDGILESMVNKTNLITVV